MVIIEFIIEERGEYPTVYICCRSSLARVHDLLALLKHNVKLQLLQKITFHTTGWDYMASNANVDVTAHI